MGAGTGTVRATSAPISDCRLVVRRDEGLTEVLQFVIAGLEIGQQVVAMAGPACLKELARGLSDGALRPESLLRNGRLIFLTAPECLSQLSKPVDPWQRGPLRPNGSLLRWVTDWSWAYANGNLAGSILEYQRRIHDFVRSFTALSLCTVHCEKLERSSLLAMLADHRRAAKSRFQV